MLSLLLLAFLPLTYTLSLPAHSHTLNLPNPLSTKTNTTLTDSHRINCYRSPHNYARVGPEICADLLYTLELDPFFNDPLVHGPQFTSRNWKDEDCVIYLDALDDGVGLVAYLDVMGAVATMVGNPCSILLLTLDSSRSQALAA